jgi:hypothetical protein
MIEKIEKADLMTEQLFPFDEPDRPATDPSPAAPRPRVRSGAIAWGLIVCASMITLLAVVLSPDARDAFGAWSASLTIASIVLIGVLALGAFVLLIALLSAIRGAQRRRAAGLAAARQD